MADAHTKEKNKNLAKEGQVLYELTNIEIGIWFCQFMLNVVKFTHTFHIIYKQNVAEEGANLLLYAPKPHTHRYDLFNNFIA